MGFGLVRASERMTAPRPRIKILPDNLIDVIAAGEVVERPASVVKELIENALDAGAEKIEVRIEDGGRRKIVVSDNGVGMDEDNCLMAIERHATSKIASIDDLKHLRTLGFRGEALPSIASVGKFTLESWDGRSESGTRLVIDNGKLIDVQPVGRARGTTVTLEGVFRRLPARRKFLRSRETESAWCLGAAEDAALADPDVAFTVVSDGGTVLDLPGVRSLHQRVASLWGTDTAGSMMTLSSVVEGVTLEGLISPPTVTFSRRTRHKVIVNGRPVRDPVLNRVISSALAGSWPLGRFPALVLILKVEDHLVDVNVHPAKREIRLRRTDHLTEAIRRAVKGIKGPVKAGPGLTSGKKEGDTFGQGGQSPRWPGPAQPVEPLSSVQENSSSVAKDSALPFGRKDIRTLDNLANLIPSEGSPEKGELSGPMKILGQVLGTYILLEDEGGLQIIDQHAAHERIVFNRLMAAREGQGPPVQKLAVPIVMDLSPSEAANLLASGTILRSFGFELEEFGSSTVRVTAVPSDLKGNVIEELLRTISSDPDALGKDPEEVAMAVSRWACRQSVMAGQRLSESQIGILIADLERAESGFSCPHGRPSRVTLAPEDLEKLFGRR